MTDAQTNIVQHLQFLRTAHQSCSIPDSWCYKGPADLLLREAEWYPEGKVKRWWRSEARACFRNAALFALEHRLPYIEGYAMSIIPVHHAWCLDHDGRVIEVTWKELGSAYFGVRFQPKLVTRGSVLFNERNEAVYKKRRKPKRDLKGVL